MKTVAAVVFGILTGLASADTLTWKETVTSGSFTDPNNWTSDGTHTTPQPGDTVKYTRAGTTNTCDTAFDTTGGGLTIDCDFFTTADMDADRHKGLLFAVALTGSGPVTKTGKGQIMTKKSWTTSGTITVNDGWLGLTSGNDWSGTYPLGTSKVVIDRTGGKDPQLFLFNKGVNLTNDVEIVGAATSTPPKASLAGSNDAGTFLGKITSSTDFEIDGGHCNYAEIYNNRIWFSGDVDALGRTMYVGSCVGWLNPCINLSGHYNCSIDSANSSMSSKISMLTLFGKGTEIDAKLTLGGVSNVLAVGASWLGTNVVVAASKRLILKESANLSPMTTLTLGKSSRLTLERGVKAMVSKLVVNGVDQGTGVFTSANLPDIIDGAGALEVLGSAVSMWKGADYGSWDEPSNWIPEQVPQTGAFVVFPYPVTNLTSTVPIDISNGGLTLCCNFRTANCGTENFWNYDFNLGLNFFAEIIGSGELVKDGVGQLLVETKIKSTGGIRVKDGILGTMPTLSSTQNEAFGANKIIIDRRFGGNPQVGIYNRNAAKHVMNDIEILGAGATPLVASLLATNDGDGFGGKVTADSDFAIASGHCYSTRGWYYGNVDAPGHTMYLSSCASWGTRLYFGGEINCSIDGANGQYADQVNLFEFGGKGTSVDADFVLASSNVFLSAATWAGTNVTLGANKKLFLNGKDNLSSKATLRLGAGSKLSIAKGVKVCVAECYANGTKVPDGVYSAANVPAVLSGYWIGEGRLRVGNPGLVIIYR